MAVGIVLAGRRNVGALRAAAPECEWEAMIPIAGRPMAGYAIAALRGAREVSRVIVAGPAALGGPDAETVAPGDSIGTTLRAALTALGPTAAEEELVIAAGDAPLLTSEAVAGLLEHSRHCGLAFTYPVVSRAICEVAFPGVRRTYVRLREGCFTGGNCFYLHRQAVEAALRLLARVYADRKHPVRLARLLGFGAVVGVALGTARIARLEAVASRLLGAPAGAWICPEPGVGFDVDRPGDLSLCRSRLEAGARRGGLPAGGREWSDAQ